MLRLARLLLPAACLAAVVAGASTGGAQSPTPAVADDASKPLVYVFSLDAQDGDRAIDQGRAPFLGRLVRGEEGGRATYYRESRGIMVSETNPNHAAMVTGAYGERSGIPGNTFAVFDEAAQKGCPADGGSVDPFAQEQENPTPGQLVVTSGEAATCLQAETFFTALERRSPGVVTAGIFGKPKLGRLLATQLVRANDFDADHLWAPCEQSSDDPPYCRDVVIDPVQRYTDDEIVMDEVIRTVNEGVDSDGARRRPNVTFVNFPDIDQTGHVTGAREAYEAQILRTDQQLQRFVTNQKARGLWARTVIFFVSDHSMDSTPPNLGTNSLERVFGDDASAVEVVLNGSVDMVYLRDRNRPDRFALLKRLRDKAVAAGFVDEALYRQPNPEDGGDRFTVDAVHPGWRIAGERTGDLLVTARTSQSFGEPANPLNGNHGAPTTLDNTLAVVSGGGQVVQQAIDGRQGARFDDTLVNPQQAENVDVAPTVMALFGQAPPAQNQGRVLTEAFAPGVLPGFGPASPGGGPGAPGGAGGGAAGGAGQATCAELSGFRSVAVRPRGRGLRFSFVRRSTAPVQVDVFRQSAGRSVVGNRLVARFRRTRPFAWSGRATRRGRRVGDGVYFARLQIRLPGGRLSERRVALVRRDGRFRVRPGFDRAPSCTLVTSAKLARAVFGGRSNRALDISFRVRREARVTVEVLRGSRVVRRLTAGTRAPGITQRLRLPSERLARGDYRIRITATAPGERVVALLTARRL